jgi:glucoamylase
MLMAQRKEHALALASNAPFISRTATFVGPQDAWHDIQSHGRIKREFNRADNGNISLAGEIDLKACGGKFVLALAFGGTTDGAALNALLSLNAGFESAQEQYIQHWKSWHKSLPNPQRGDLVSTSMIVLRSHRSKQFSGAGVASLSTPWGEARGDGEMGYHLVWSRDLVEEAEGLLAGGDHADALDSLNYLRATQKPEGGWPKNMRLDGQADSQGVQLDEAALPLLLANLLHRHGVLNDTQMEAYWPMIRDAAAFIIRSGPETGQDRWENTPGLSPYTLATEIAALLIAARIADQFGDANSAGIFRQSADMWNDLIEPWTYATDTPLARRAGVDGYYVRIAPAPGMHTLKRRGQVPHMKQAHDLPVEEVVSPDALALVRLGLRAANDPRILNTVKVIDAMTRTDLPGGSCWRRYNGDYYGETEDGSPFAGHDHKSGIGRPWPLLVGERGHYELAAGNLDRARELSEVMSGFASEVGLLPEQVWDREDIPDRGLFSGRPSGSAMPLAWAHAEYLRLLRSIRDGQLFDQPVDTRRRYVESNTVSTLCLWRFDHQIDSIFSGRTLRIELMAPASVHYTTDDWKTTRDISTRDTGLGFHLVDLPVEQFKPRSRVRFTFQWPEVGGKWEGKDFELVVEPPLEHPGKISATTHISSKQRASSVRSR